MENVDTSSESSINDQEFLEQVEREQIVEKYEMVIFTCIQYLS